MCLAMLACPNLLTAIQTASDFLKITDQRRNLLISIDQDRAVFRLDIGLRGNRLPDLIIETFGVSAFQRLFGWLIQSDIHIEKVMLRFSSNMHAQCFGEYLQAEPIFNCNVSAIVFPAKHLNSPILRRYHELEDLFSLYPFDFLPPDYESQPLSERIRAMTAAALSRCEKPPTMRDIARIFGLSLGTFRRRLTAEGTSLMEIRNICRVEMASQLLAETGLTIKEIAFRTQFCNVGAFRRAFRSWTGRSPRAFRLEMRVLSKERSATIVN